MSEGEKWMLGCTIVMALCTLAAVVISVVALNKKQEVKIEQPLIVAMEKEFATKRELEKLESANNQDHRDLFSKLGGVDRGAGQKISTEVGAIHTRINGIEKAVGGLEKATELQNQRLAQMDSKMDRLIERT